MDIEAVKDVEVQTMSNKDCCNSTFSKESYLMKLCRLILGVFLWRVLNNILTVQCPFHTFVDALQNNFYSITG